MSVFVPITSDLAGYQEFWLRVVVDGVIALATIATALLLLVRFWIVPALARALKGTM